MGHYFLVFSEPVEGREDEYNDWYSEKHLDDVLEHEEFVAAQRFVFHELPKGPADPPMKYLAIYETAEGVSPEEAAAALGATARQNKVALEEGREQPMPISDAMSGVRSYYFSPITERKTR